MGICGSIEPWSESTFPFQYIIIVQWWQSLEPPSSSPGRGRQMHLLNFCTKLNAQHFLFETFFWCKAYFWHRRALKWFCRRNFVLHFKWQVMMTIDLYVALSNIQLPSLLWSRQWFSSPSLILSYALYLDRYDT